MTPQTPLLRQVSPSFLKNGVPTTQAFSPTRKDERQLSVDNGDLIDPEISYGRFTGKSAGVLAVTFEECSVSELPVIEDAHPYPEHCSIDFSGLSNRLVAAKAKELRDYALGRNWLYQP